MWKEITISEKEKVIDSRTWNFTFKSFLDAMASLAATPLTHSFTHYPSIASLLITSWVYSFGAYFPVKLRPTVQFKKKDFFKTILHSREKNWCDKKSNSWKRKFPIRDWPRGGLAENFFPTAILSIANGEDPSWYGTWWLFISLWFFCHVVEKCKSSSWGISRN